MHIHGSHLTVDAAAFFSAAHGERATAAQRAAEVRRKLKSVAIANPGSGDDEVSLMIGKWLGGAADQPTAREPQSPAASGRVSEFG